MLAEIFIARLEAQVRANQRAEQAEARFVRFVPSVPFAFRDSRDGIGHGPGKITTEQASASPA
jgi:hypothetical protein